MWSHQLCIGMKLGFDNYPLLQKEPMKIVSGFQNDTIYGTLYHSPALGWMKHIFLKIRSQEKENIIGTLITSLPFPTDLNSFQNLLNIKDGFFFFCLSSMDNLKYKLC
jgi:hypothetical protein